MSLEQTENAIANLKAARDAVVAKLGNDAAAAQAAMAAADQSAAAEIQGVADSLNAAANPPAPEAPPSA